ncbi:MAG: amidohydrolase family protein [Chloroflexi bacterium]|nr:amidohydrolase family protein [Chloroflexota bacterium]
MPIIDSHCHAWNHWPYLPEVPDPDHHGSVETLLNQMDVNGVDSATIVCAQIHRNRDNNDYVAAAVKKYPDRLNQFADVDSFWSDTYHTPGAANRLEMAAKKWPMKAFTHYVAGEDDGRWFNSQEGKDFFSVARDVGLIASIAMGPHHQNEIRKVAESFPEVPILCHHMSALRSYGDDAQSMLDNVTESAKLPNMHLKLSGFHYLCQPERVWDFPYTETHWVYEACYEAFGTRLCWGSDFPVVKKAMTHLQSLEAFRSHLTFISDEDREAIQGGTLANLLANARTIT